MFLLVRKWHRWIAWLAAVPAAIVVSTGTVLHLRRVNPWIQPMAAKSVQVSIPGIALDQIFSRLLATDHRLLAIDVRSWGDIKSVEFKPHLGIWSFKSNSYYEIQVDVATGKVLSLAPRRSMWLMQLHEGSIFGANILWWVFFPTGLLLCILEFTGIYLLLAGKLKKVS
jgi:hypothetical protein